jgi:hypothetical protein
VEIKSNQAFHIHISESHGQETFFPVNPLSW